MHATAPRRIWSAMMNGRGEMLGEARLELRTKLVTRVQEAYLN